LLTNRQRYRCSPGKAVTHARALIRSRVVEVTSKHIVRQATRTVTLKIKHVGHVPPRLRQRGRLPGPC